MGLPANVGAVSEPREILDWTTFGEASRSLAQSIADDGFEADMILAIARGGLLVAGALGYALGIKNLYTMNVEFYTGIDERLEVPMILPPVPDISLLADAKVLIADDVADTGNTLKLINSFCEGKVGELRTAVLYEKPWNIVPVQYIWKKTDKWIEFPWSSQPPIAGHGVAEA